MSDLAEVERLAGGLLRQLTSGQRRSLMRKMAGVIARSNRARIAAQRTPDGNAFAPRAKKDPPPQGQYAVAFLYPSGGGGEPRRVTMKSWVMQNGMMTGYDIEAGALRSFFFDKVIKWLPVDPDQQNAGGGKLRNRRSALRRKAMFRRLATARYLRSEADDQGFWVGFTGRAAEVASIHHYGLRDRPSLKARVMRYPERPLLGVSNADSEALLDILFTKLADNLTYKK